MKYVTKIKALSLNVAASPVSAEYEVLKYKY